MLRCTRFDDGWQAVRVRYSGNRCCTALDLPMDLSFLQQPWTEDGQEAAGGALAVGDGGDVVSADGAERFAGGPQRAPLCHERRPLRRGLLHLLILDPLLFKLQRLQLCRLAHVHVSAHHGQGPLEVSKDLHMMWQAAMVTHIAMFWHAIIRQEFRTFQTSIITPLQVGMGFDKNWMVLTFQHDVLWIGLSLHRVACLVPRSAARGRAPRLRQQRGRCAAVNVQRRRLCRESAI